MAITFTNASQIATAGQSTIWINQTQASLSFFFRYESAGSVASSVLNTNYFIYCGLSPFYIWTHAIGTANSLNLGFAVNSASTGAQLSSTFNVGTVYHVAVTYDQGQQTLWINGIPSTIGTLTGPTPTGSWPIDFGVTSVPGTPFVYTLSDVIPWNGYVLSATDVAALRDGADPTTIGTSASGRWRWTMAGTVGNSVQVGDPGIANSFGDTAYDLKSVSGSGTAVYSPPLAFTPSVSATPYVASSGKIIGFTFNAISDGSTVIPTQPMIAPTITQNGNSLGSLVNAWITGYHPVALYSLPPGTSISPSDSVTISAPAGWVMTPLGITAAMNNLAVDNRSGRSSVGTDKLQKTFKPGWNNGHLGEQNWSTYSVTKNWRYRCDSFTSVATQDANGKPLTGTSSTTYSSFYNTGPSTTIDNTLALPTGLWAVGWDDTGDHVNDPTTCGLLTWTQTILSVTERLDLYNPGVNGVGIVRVFQVSALSTVPTSQDAVVDLHLSISNANSTFHFDNLVIYGPGDFTYAAGQPTVLDRSDPYAISKVYLDRLQNSAGSLRWVDACWNFAGISQESEPEQVFRLTDFTWGLWSGKVNNSVYWTEARPWNQTTSPYFYTTLFGSPYTATLAAPIPDTTTTVLTISDAATAPVLTGLRLLLPTGELCRVLSVSGSTVTVERGSCSTTPAPCGVGAIQVQNRWPVAGAIPQGQYLELVSATPHGVETGQALEAYGNWPVFTFTDGQQGLSGNPITYYSLPAMVTGANTAVLYLPGNETPLVTLNQTYTLDATCRFSAQWPDSPAIPVEYVAKVTGQFQGCNLHINVPHAASDSLVDAIAIWVRDNFPPGRKVYVEYSNEPWNYLFANFNMLKLFSNWLYPSTSYGWEFYILRATQIWQRFRARFNDNGAGRSGEIVGLINSNKFDTSGVALKLEFAQNLGVPIGVVAIAVYTALENWAASPVTQACFWQYDDEQAIDLYVHDLYYNPTQYPAIFASMNSVIASYNQTYGQKVMLYGYEGGVGCAAPVLTTSLAAAIDNASQTVTVNNWQGYNGNSYPASAGMVTGVPVLVESEWMLITALSGNTLTVNRGQFGTTAVAHAANVTLRPAYLERSHDIIYNPNWYIAEQDLVGFVQQNGFAQLNQYALSMGAADTNTYFGAYHIQTQGHGTGDGSDGKADNRLCLACPGKANSKAATVNQDMSNVSVRGQAFIDWMKATQGGGRKPRLVFPSYRKRS